MPKDECRLLVDPPAPGAWNMAVDEALLEGAARTGECFWRFYTWQEPTLSLGYFQAHEDRQAHASSLASPVVRRASGGGAILHDCELTYSCVWPEGHALASGRLRLYEAVHASLVAVLARYDISALLCVGAAATQSTSQPFLCFQRRSPGDVLVGPIKIAGSAQRRLRGAVLQHGSVLLARSPQAPELDGLAETSGLVLRWDQLVEAWRENLAASLGLRWRAYALSHEQTCRAAVLMETKYASPPWTRDRGRGLPRGMP